jgi:hypothetical protein
MTKQQIESERIKQALKQKKKKIKTIKVKLQAKPLF